jgi:probable F420-dependent oxidoreductase
VLALQVGVQAEPRDGRGWTDLARRVESLGFDALLLGDHPGSGASPWPALGAAAAVTERLRVGTYVLQCGVREPVHIAADAASLDVLAPGRVLLGLGAGHTPMEWEDIGRRRPNAAERVARLTEVVDVVIRLLAGEVVTLRGQHVQVHDARLEDLPVGGRVPLLVGGGHPDLLRFAARRADVVALSGLGRTLPDGHRHEVRWTEADLERQLALVREATGGAGRAPVLDALVQRVVVTGDRRAMLEEIARGLAGPLVAVEDLATTPFLLVGTHEEMAEQLVRQGQRWGITRYVVREPAVPDVAPVLDLLTEAGRLSR